MCMLDVLLSVQNNFFFTITELRTITNIMNVLLLQLPLLLLMMYPRELKFKSYVRGVCANCVNNIETCAWPVYFKKSYTGIQLSFFNSFFVVVVVVLNTHNALFWLNIKFCLDTQNLIKTFVHSYKLILRNPLHTYIVIRAIMMFLLSYRF